MPRPSRLFLSLLLFAAVWVVSTATTQAASVTFTDRSTFNAASTELATIDFNGIASAGGFAALNSPTTLYTSSGIGVTFTVNPGTSLHVFDNGFTNVGYGPGGYLGVGLINLPEVILDLTFSTPITAAGLDIMSSGSFANATATLANGDVLPFSVVGFMPRFFGFMTTTPIVSLTLRTPLGGGFLIDNFTFGQAVGQANPVPEPTTMLLLSTGLAGVAAKVRRRRGERR